MVNSRKVLCAIVSSKSLCAPDHVLSCVEARSRGPSGGSSLTINFSPLFCESPCLYIEIDALFKDAEAQNLETVYLQKFPTL